MSTNDATVRLQRTIAASPATVYRAWLDPEILVRWMAAGSLTVTRAEVDERPGGRFDIWQAGPDGTEAGGFACEVLELVPDERIVLAWQFVGPERVADPSHDSRLTVSLRAVPGGTELTLVHERLEALRVAMPEVAAKVVVGWDLALERLVAALAPAGAS